MVSALFGVITPKVYALTAAEAEAIISALALDGAKAEAIRGLVTVTSVPVPSTPTTDPEMPGPSPADSTAVAERVSDMLYMFRSKPLFMAYALSKVQQIQLTMEPDGAAESFGYGWSEEYTSATPKIEEMAEIVAGFHIHFSLAKAVRVKTTVQYLDSDWNPYFEGTSYFWPQEGKGGSWTIPNWASPEMRFAQNIRMELPGVRRLVVHFRDEYGELTDTRYLYPVSSGSTYLLPRQMIDNNGEILAYMLGEDGTEKRAFISIRSGLKLEEAPFDGGSIRPTMPGAQILTDPVNITISPKSHLGKGEDILVEATFTEKTGATVLAVTSEGERAHTIVVINATTGEVQEYVNPPSGMLIVPFSPGTYHVLGLWDTFTDDSLDGWYDDGGGKGGGIAGGGGWE